MELDQLIQLYEDLREREVHDLLVYLRFLPGIYQVIHHYRHTLTKEETTALVIASILAHRHLNFMNEIGLHNPDRRYTPKKFIS